MTESEIDQSTTAPRGWREVEGWSESMSGRSSQCVSGSPRSEAGGLGSWDGNELYWPTESARKTAFRALQSWYRTEVLRARPGPHSVDKSQPKPVGSELAQYAGDAGANFLHAGIHDYAGERLKQL